MSADDHAAADPAGSVAGSRIAGYRLEERIGQGGMAVVFRAYDERLDRQVALKVLAPTLADDAEFQRRFIRESRAAAAIDDPHIVPVFAAGEAAGVLYIAMRYVAGGDAQSLLTADGPLPPARVAAIISPVASALDAAHRADLVHRDVKPSNMLMDVLPGRPDHVYLSDFGLAKAVSSTSGVTAAGTVMGTLAYMPPEQIRGKQVDGRADQYALACSAFELLAGAPPFQHDEPTAIMYAQLSESPPQLTSRRPGLPAAVDGVLDRALAKAPGDRYESCGQFAEALRHALGLPPYRSAPRIPAGATALSPSPDTVDAPATETTIPVVPDTAIDVGQPTAGSSPARPRRRLRRPIVLAGIVTATAGVVAGLLVASSPAQAVTVPISLKSALPAVTGDVYVVYLGGAQAKAEVYGEIRKASDGDVAELYAQPFPYRKAPTRVGSVVLHPAGGAARYEFQVTPTLATRYRVELFGSSTSSAPLARSGVSVIYVARNEKLKNTQKCGRPTCYESLQTIILVPPSALATEMAKTLNPYFGINLASTKTVPAPPKYLYLGDANALLLASHRVSADEFTETVSLSFGVGDDAYNWSYYPCFKDTEAADGIGLPGQHGCGDQRIAYAAKYAG